MAEKIKDSEKQFSSDIEIALGKAVHQYLIEGNDNAFSANRQRKLRMRLYKQLWQGLFGEILGTSRIYRPTLAKLIRTLIANSLGKLIPDPVTHDWLSLDSIWPGMDQYIDDVEALLRHKFATMHIPSNSTFYDETECNLADLFVYGTCAAVVSGDVLEEQINGQQAFSVMPQCTRLDVFQVWPWSVDVNDIAQTACSVFDPISDDKLDELEGQVDVAFIRAHDQAMNHRYEDHSGGPR